MQVRAEGPDAVEREGEKEKNVFLHDLHLSINASGQY